MHKLSYVKIKNLHYQRDTAQREITNIGHKLEEERWQLIKLTKISIQDIYISSLDSEKVHREIGKSSKSIS